MKRYILLLLAACLLLSGCSTTLMGNTGDVHYETFPELDSVNAPSLFQYYFTAQKLLYAGFYEEAYVIYQQIADQYPKAAAEASYFTWLEDTLILTDTYIDAQLTTSEKTVYDDHGQIVIKSEQREWQGSVPSEDKTYCLSETWKYNIDAEQTLTDAPYYLEYTYDPKGTVIAVTRTPEITSYYQGLAIPGYTVNYTHDADGRIIRESGVDRLHHIPSTGGLTVSELAFEANYTYDASGHLLRYERSYPDVQGGISWDQYTYDESGNLLIHESRKEGNVFFDPTVGYESILREYRYDKDGNKVFESTLTLRGESAETAQRDYTQTVFQYENGHLVKQTQTFEGSETVIVTEYTYGDLFVYIRYPKEVTDDGSTTAETGESK